MILGNLTAIKEKHAALFCQLGEVTSAQKHCMDSLRINMSSVMELIQHLQQITSLEVFSQTEHYLNNHHTLCYCTLKCSYFKASCEEGIRKPPSTLYDNVLSIIVCITLGKVLELFLI